LEAKENQNDDSEKAVEETPAPVEQPTEEKKEEVVEQPKTETTTKKQDSVMKLLKQRNEECLKSVASHTLDAQLTASLESFTQD
jgi:hypothetical protein